MNTKEIIPLDLITSESPFANMQFPHVPFIQAEFSAADGLTKFRKNAVMLEPLLTSDLSNSIHKWIVSKAKFDSDCREGNCFWAHDIAWFYVLSKLQNC